MSLQRIPLDLLDPSPLQIRHEMDEGELKELMDSLKRSGQQRPIKARPVGGRFETVFGHRTAEATRRLGWDEMDAVVVEMTDKEVMMAQWEENEFRADLSDYDKADWIRKMIEDHGHDREWVANEMKISKSRVSQLLKMTQIEQEFSALNLSKLSPRHAYEITDTSIIHRDNLCNKIGEYMDDKGVAPSIKETKDMKKQIIYYEDADDAGLTPEEFDHKKKEYEKRKKSLKDRDNLLSFYGVDIYDTVTMRMKVRSFDALKKYLCRYVMRIHEQTPMEDRMEILGRLEY